MIEEDARTKQDLLFEVSSLNARLSDEIVKNEQLQNNWNELKKWLEDENNQKYSQLFAIRVREIYKILKDSDD